MNIVKYQHIRILIFVLVTLAVLLTACDTTEPTPIQIEVPTEAATEVPKTLNSETGDASQEAATPEPEIGIPVAKGYGQITDVATLDDKLKGQIAWKGMQQAEDELGVEVQLLEGSQVADDLMNMSETANYEFDGLVTVGVSLADAIKTVAEANPHIPFIMVDDESQADNIRGLQFATDQAAFLAGYVAADISETGIVCTYLGFKVPAMVRTVVGFESGINYYNERKGTDVLLLGWKTYPASVYGGDGAISNDIENNDSGRRFIENFVDEGCDIIFPVADQTGLGSLVAAQDRRLIGIYTDQIDSNPDVEDIYLTSVLKNIDLAVFESIQSIEQGTFEGGTNYLGTLENNGVALAPFHNFETEIAQEVLDELETIKADIINGSISTGWPVPPPLPALESDATPEGDASPEGEE